MRLQMLLFALLIFFVCSAQHLEKNSICISTPVIWTHAEALFFSLGNPRYSGGTTTNYGINLQYSRSIYKNFSGQIGVGYFNQSFNIERPVRYEDATSTNRLYYTQSYSYDNLHLIVGINYAKNIVNTSYIANAGISYNYLHSYRQKYVIYKTTGTQQINHKSMPLGDIINLNFGLERYIGKEFSIKISGIFSLYTKWRNDETFFKSQYSDDSQQAAINKYSIGTAFSVNYNF